MFSCGRNGELLRHKSSVHLKMKPYKCVHCDFSFGWEGNLLEWIEAMLPLFLMPSWFFVRVIVVRQ